MHNNARFLLVGELYEYTRTVLQVKAAGSIQMIKQMECIEVTTILPFRKQENIHDLVAGEWHIAESK